MSINSLFSTLVPSLRYSPSVLGHVVLIDVCILSLSLICPVKPWGRSSKGSGIQEEVVAARKEVVALRSALFRTFLRSFLHTESWILTCSVFGCLTSRAITITSTAWHFLRPFATTEMNKHPQKQLKNQQKLETSQTKPTGYQTKPHQLHPPSITASFRGSKAMISEQAWAGCQLSGPEGTE